MTNTKEFDIFGVRYKTTQWPAVAALSLIERSETVTPTEVLSRTSVEVGYNEWLRLDCRSNINDFVRDRIEKIPPRVVLTALTKIVNDYSFGFMAGWKGVKIPKRFLNGADSVSSDHVDPVISQLVADGVASYRELEEYYSLEDAFKMFDILMAKSLNAALANEELEKKVKAKRHG